jgi:hypothetical protein
MSTITLQNLRAVSPGVEPESLLPGQLAFNVPDRIMYVGDGSNLKSPYTGTPVQGIAGLGWFSVPLAPEALDYIFLVNPSYYGQTPADQDYLKWDATLGHLVWVSQNAQQGSNIYMTNNAAVSAAAGATTSTKITSALGLTPLNNDTVIVAGAPGDIYEGYYGYIGASWAFISHYAWPIAANVRYDNSTSGLIATTVQAAINELLTISSLKLPLAGGIMTGDIEFNNGQPVNAGSY